MQIKYGVTLIATLQEIFNIIGKELGISDRNQWVEGTNWNRNQCIQHTNKQ